MQSFAGGIINGKSQGLNNRHLSRVNNSMNNLEQCEGAKTQIGVTPEIQMVMSILDKEIQRLDENISLLTQKLHPVLTPKRPKKVGKDRAKRDCDLAEDIQKDIDVIGRMNDLINDLKIRVAL
jgi:hypothetical protein